MSFLVLKLLSEEKSAVCFTLIVFLLLCGCYCSVSFPRDGMGWFVVHECDVCWSYSLTFEIPNCTYTLQRKQFEVVFARKL